ncbi:hypothetical protein [Flavobacterium sp. FlaQc-50]|uniref:hypothetical protein n=1 Tax=unclassified Flavobacterium TaxID=196869 RepID=UPI003757FA4E
MNTNESINQLENSNTDNEIIKTHEWKIEDLLHGVVGHPNGFFYKVLPKDLANVYLSLCGREQLTTIPIIQLLQQVNDCSFHFYEAGNDSWKEVPLPSHILEYQSKVLNAMILNQLALEANDLLKGTPEYDNYLDNLIKKTNKALERKAKKLLSKAYGAEQEMLINVFNSIDNFTKKFAMKMPSSSFYLNQIIDEYDADPTKFLNRQVELDKLDS